MALPTIPSLVFLICNAANGCTSQQPTEWYMIVQSPHGTVLRLDHFTKEECEQVRAKMLKGMAEKIKSAECFVVAP